MKIQNVYFFSQTDHGDAIAGTDQWQVQGKTEYGGRGDYRPFVKRCEVSVDQKTSDVLMAANLIFLPYWGEDRPPLKLKDYLQALASGDKTKIKSLGPKKPEFFFTHPKDQIQFFSSIYSPKTTNPVNFISIHVDNHISYVDQLFYRLEGFDLAALQKNQKCNDQFAEGSLLDYMEKLKLAEAILGVK